MAFRLSLVLIVVALASQISCLNFLESLKAKFSNSNSEPATFLNKDINQIPPASIDTNKQPSNNQRSLPPASIDTNKPSSNDQPKQSQNVLTKGGSVSSSHQTDMLQALKAKLDNVIKPQEPPVQNPSIAAPIVSDNVQPNPPVPCVCQQQTDVIANDECSNLWTRLLKAFGSSYKDVASKFSAQYGSLDKVRNDLKTNATTAEKLTKGFDDLVKSVPGADAKLTSASITVKDVVQCLQKQTVVDKAQLLINKIKSVTNTDDIKKSIQTWLNKN